MSVLLRSCVAPLKPSTSPQTTERVISGVVDAAVAPTKKYVPSIAVASSRRYCASVAANSATGRRNPKISRRNGAQITTAGVFFRLQYSVMAAVCGQASAWPGAYYPGIPTLHTAATQSRRKDGGGSTLKVGAPPMTALIPSKIRALAHRRMALSALRANSSLSVRLSRYNAHMTIVRTLEAQGGAQ